MATYNERPVTKEALYRGVNPDNGVGMLQVTSGNAQCTCIYSEISYGDAAGRYFIYRKQGSPVCPEIAGEFWRFDFERMENVFVAAPESCFGTTVPPDQTKFVYSAWEDEHTAAVHIINIESLDEEVRFVKAEKSQGLSCANAVTEDYRYVVSHARPTKTRRCLCVFDTAEGTSELIGDYGADFCNPHIVLDPSGSGDVLLQINRNATFHPDGSPDKLFLPEGPRHDIYNIYDKTFRPTRAGYPYTCALGGHSSWLGRTGRYVTNGFVVDLEELAKGGVISAMGFFPDMERREQNPDIIANYYPAHLEMTKKTGSLFVLDRIEDEPKVYGQGFYCGHPNASRDGRYFVADVLGEHLLVIGSFKTGNTEILTRAGGSMGGAMCTQPVPWFMPGNRHVIFTSDDTGLAQVCALEIPPELFGRLDGE